MAWCFQNTLLIDLIITTFSSKQTKVHVKNLTLGNFPM